MKTRKITLDELSNSKEKPILVTIKENAPVFQDMHFLRWPYCLPIKKYQDPNDKRRINNPNLTFEATWCPGTNEYWDCKRHGFGIQDKSKVDRDAYGNGSIYVSGFHNVNFVAGSYDTLVADLRSGDDEVQKVIPRIKTSKPKSGTLPEKKTA